MMEYPKNSSGSWWGALVPLSEFKDFSGGFGFGFWVIYDYYYQCFTNSMSSVPFYVFLNSSDFPLWAIIELWTLNRWICIPLIINYDWIIFWLCNGFSHGLIWKWMGWIQYYQRRKERRKKNSVIRWFVRCEGWFSHFTFF